MNVAESWGDWRMAEKVERAVCAHSHPTLCDPMNYSPAGSPSPWDFPGKNTGVGCHFLLQGIFPTQGSILCLWGFLKWQVDSVTTEAPGKPERAAMLYYCPRW